MQSPNTEPVVRKPTTTKKTVFPTARNADRITESDSHNCQKKESKMAREIVEIAPRG